jgi:hypothetical protein
MLGTKPFFLPSLNISTIAAPTHSLSEHYSMTLMVAILEALDANDTGRVCSAVHALCNCISS